MVNIVTCPTRKAFLHTLNSNYLGVLMSVLQSPFSDITSRKKYYRVKTLKSFILLWNGIDDRVSDSFFVVYVTLNCHVNIPLCFFRGTWEFGDLSGTCQTTLIKFSMAWTRLFLWWVFPWWLSHKYECADVSQFKEVKFLYCSTVGKGFLNGFHIQTENSQVLEGARLTAINTSTL